MVYGWSICLSYPAILCLPVFMLHYFQSLYVFQFYLGSMFESFYLLFFFLLYIVTWQSVFNVLSVYLFCSFVWLCVRLSSVCLFDCVYFCLCALLSVCSFVCLSVCLLQIFQNRRVGLPVRYLSMKRHSNQRNFKILFLLFVFYFADYSSMHFHFDGKSVNSSWQTFASLTIQASSCT